MWQSVGTERPLRRRQESSESSGRASSFRLLTSMWIIRCTSLAVVVGMVN